MTTNNPYNVVVYENGQAPVQLLYDTWIYRPHILVELIEPRAYILPHELRAMYELIGKFLRAEPQFDHGVILSFRQGAWNVPRTNNRHARLYVPKEIYIQKATLAIQRWNIPPCNKRARNGLSVETSVNDWVLDRVREGIKQKESLIKQGISNRTFLGNIPLASFNASPQRFELVWQIPTPRSGVVALSAVDTNLEELYNFMSQVYTTVQNQLRQYSQNMNLTFDCHLCLHVRGQIGTNVTCRQGQILLSDGQETTNENLVGYIQVAENHYLWWLPENLKQIWFKAFSQNDHFVGT